MLDCSTGGALSPLVRSHSTAKGRPSGMEGWNETMDSLGLVLFENVLDDGVGGGGRRDAGING